MNLTEIAPAIATIATIIGTFYTALLYHRPKGAAMTDPQANVKKYPFLVILSLVVLAWGAVLFDYYERKTEPVDISYIEGWNGSPPIYAMAVNSKELIQYKNDYKLMMLARVNFVDKDPISDSIVEISGLYTITGDHIALAHPSSNVLRFVPLQPNQVQLYLLLIPKNIPAESIKTLGDVERIGGKILTSRGQIVIGGPPQETQPISK